MMRRHVAALAALLALSGSASAQMFMYSAPVASASAMGGLSASGNLSDLTNAAAARLNLGLGTASTQASTAFLQVSKNLSDVSAASARANLGLGTAATQSTAAFLQSANNLSDVTAATARTNLGLGTIATQSAAAVAVTGGAINGTTLGATTPEPASVTNITHSGPEMDTSLVVVAPATGATVSLIPGTTIINPAASLVSLATTLPACSASANGQIVRFATTKAITTLSVGALVGAVAGAASSLLLGGANAYICQGATATWYRLY